MLLHLKLQESHLISTNCLHEVTDTFELEDDTEELLEMRERIEPYRFTDESNKMSTRNPAPELLDVFLDDEDETMAFVVMPVLRGISDVLSSSDDTFQTIGDVVEFGIQFLEEIHFLNGQMLYHLQVFYSFFVIDTDTCVQGH